MTLRQFVATIKSLLPILAVVIALLSFAFVLKDHYSKKNRSVTITEPTRSVVPVQPETRIAPPAPVPVSPKVIDESTVADARGMMVNPAEILSPQPGDTWFIGNTYTIRWKNTVPPETHDYNKFVWNINIYRPNQGHWEFRHIPIMQSSYEVKINDVYQHASDYYMQIYVVCDVGIHTCGVPGGSFYQTAGPIRIAPRE